MRWRSCRSDGIGAICEFLRSRAGPATFRRTTACVHLSYVGTLLPPGFETLRAVFAAVARLRADDPAGVRALRLHFFGTSNQRTADAPARVLPDRRRVRRADVVTEQAPRLDYFDALAVLRDSTAVLLLGSSERHYTPSKVFPALVARAADARASCTRPATRPICSARSDGRRRIRLVTYDDETARRARRRDRRRARGAGRRARAIAADAVDATRARADVGVRARAAASRGVLDAVRARDSPIRLTIVADASGAVPRAVVPPHRRELPGDRSHRALRVATDARRSRARDSAARSSGTRRSLDGYRWHVVRDSRARRRRSRPRRFRGLDVHGDRRGADATTEPDVVLVPGWHSITLVRAILAARRARHSRPLSRRHQQPARARRMARGSRGIVKTRALLRCIRRYLAVGRRSREYLLAHGVAADAHLRVAARRRQRVLRRERGAAPAPRRGRAAARAGCGARAGRFRRAVCRQARGAETSDRRRARRRATRPGRGAGRRGLGRVSTATCAPKPSGSASASRSLGFVNQSRARRGVRRGRLSGAAERHDESWGLVVNEAMATGLPAVVSDRVGCAPDLVSPGETGEVLRAGDRRGSGARARARARARRPRRRWRTPAARASRGTTSRPPPTGLVAACQSLATPIAAPPARASSPAAAAW